MPPARSIKSRSGCRQCKVRRIKCDEASPACKNCVRKGVECPGYATQYKWTTKRQTNPDTFTSGSVRWRDLSADGNHLNPAESTATQLSNEGIIQARVNSAASVQGLADVDLNGLQVSNPSQALVLDTTAHNHPIYNMPAEKTDSRRKARRLLAQFYHSSSVNASLMNQETRLVEYYFSTIARLYSCVDSSYNPFRRSVGQLWTSSAATYYAIQSMAAAYLGNQTPGMVRQGQKLHQKAADHLVEEMQICPPSSLEFDKPLLTLLLLGMSACWQRSSDLGLPYLRTARRLITQSLADESFGMATPRTPVVEFFEEALVYWEMVSAFVTDDGKESLADDVHLLSVMDSFQSDTRIQPHVWTGVSPEAQILLAEVGRFVRRAKSDSTHTESHYDAAVGLEERLLALEMPRTEIVAPVDDHDTDVSHLIKLAQMTRDCGFLELYRMFPGVLRMRLGISDMGNSPATQLCCRSRNWLTKYAMQIIDQLESIPARSSVRVHQLLPLLLAACELAPASQHGLETDAAYEDWSMTCDRMRTSRAFVQGRLIQLTLQLPSRPIHTMQKLINEVWHRLDTSSDEHASDVFWLDVMEEKGWETLMG